VPTHSARRMPGSTSSGMMAASRRLVKVATLAGLEQPRIRGWWSGWLGAVCSAQPSEGTPAPLLSRVRAGGWDGRI
jgi:hypothetical protein